MFKDECRMRERETKSRSAKSKHVSGLRKIYKMNIRYEYNEQLISLARRIVERQQQTTNNNSNTISTRHSESSSQELKCLSNNRITTATKQK